MFAGNFAPRGWMFCAGQLLSIAEYTAVFALVGTTYGGDGQVTFGLPDLRGRIPVGTGQGNGLPSVELGEMSGTESVTLITTQIPPHNHTGVLVAANSSGTGGTPTGTVLAASNSNNIYAAGPASINTADVVTLSSTGGNAPHGNIMPSLVLNYIICIEGIFPSRN